MLIFCDCDGKIDDDDDLAVTLVYKDAQRNIDFIAEFSDFKKTKKSAALSSVRNSSSSTSPFPISVQPFRCLAQEFRLTNSGAPNGSSSHAISFCFACKIMGEIGISTFIY